MFGRARQERRALGVLIGIAASRHHLAKGGLAGTARPDHRDEPGIEVYEWRLSPRRVLDRKLTRRSRSTGCANVRLDSPKIEVGRMGDQQWPSGRRRKRLRWFFLGTWQRRTSRSRLATLMRAQR
jgi:hypothetical protein